VTTDLCLANNAFDVSVRLRRIDLGIFLRGGGGSSDESAISELSEPRLASLPDVRSVRAAELISVWLLREAELPSSIRRSLCRRRGLSGSSLCDSSTERIDPLAVTPARLSPNRV